MKLKSFLNLRLAQTLRNKVDVYYWRGIPCARKWPNPSRTLSARGSAATRQALKLAMAWLKAQPPQWRFPWRHMLTPHGRTYQDLVNTLALKRSYGNNLTTSPYLTDVTLTYFPTFTLVAWQHQPGYTPDYYHYAWRLHTYADKPPVYTYFYHSLEPERVGTRLRSYAYNWDAWLQIPGPSYDPPNRTWTVTIPGHVDNVAFSYYMQSLPYSNLAATPIYLSTEFIP